jgi:capsular exopolysaccharide synthesis family protein
MSKIEKALRRARGDKSLVVSFRQHSVEAQESSSRDLSVPAVNDTQLSAEYRAQTASAIARMREYDLRNKSELTQQRMIHPEMAENSTVQAFRELRTKILQKSRGHNCIIMITSVSGQGGSTFVAMNLSSAFAFDAGKTALLMDCNLRNPGFQNLFKDSTPVGLTDYLEKGDMDVSEIIHSVGVERLRVVPAGEKREIPSEYFTSQKMKQLMASIRQRYAERFIILDAPPMTQSADTQILAELCDFIVLVVPYGKVTNLQIEDCVKQMDSKKLLGIVFNNDPNLPALDWNDLIRSSMQLARDYYGQLLKYSDQLLKRIKQAARK